MILFKACPRCQRGDIEIERNFFGWHALCLQCGYMKDLEKPEDAWLVLAEKPVEKEPVARSA